MGDACGDRPPAGLRADAEQDAGLDEEGTNRGRSAGHVGRIVLAESAAGSVGGSPHGVTPWDAR